MPYNNQNTISTNSISMFDSNGMLLKMSFLDESLSIGLWTPVEDGGKKTYPKENREAIILTKERVAALYNIIVDRALPAYKEGKLYNGGVFTNIGQTNVFEVRIENGEIYAVYHKDIDENRIPKKSILFHFPKSPIIENYNTKNGEFEIPEIDANFLIFIKVLEAFMTIASTGAGAHSDRYSNRFTNEKRFSYLSGLANKLGVTIGDNFEHRVTSTFSDAGASTPAPAVNTVTNLEDVLLNN